ncbi:MAG: DEAD/DEAH box helicase [Bacteroidota bacterium]
MTFEQLGLIDPILKALAEEKYTHPTPIQEQAIPVLLEGRDLLGCAQTGTGKTAAFSIPIIQHLATDPRRNDRRRRIKALIVTPTRELAIQIGESIRKYAKYTGLRSTVIFGGVKQGEQVRELKRGIDILVATPGRLLDLNQQGYVDFSDIEYSVLDEADHMLDMGFIHDIRRIVNQLPEDRQSLFFSATMPPEIVKLSKSILGNPKRITIKPEQATAERVEQAIYFVPKKRKVKLLLHLLKGEYKGSTALVFSRTKYGADRIARMLRGKGIEASAIHGNKTQNQRQKSLKFFKNGKTQVLVATDIAARGIDVSGLPLVVNYDLPNVPETYVHRIGRTGRAAASGIALSFCQADEKPYLRSIQRLIDQQIPVIEEHPFLETPEEAAEAERLAAENPPKNNQRSNRSRGGNQNRSQNRSRNRNRNRKRPNRKSGPKREA